VACDELEWGRGVYYAHCSWIRMNGDRYQVAEDARFDNEQKNLARSEVRISEDINSLASVGCPDGRTSYKNQEAESARIIVVSFGRRIESPS
jgi:hypothetical protein